MAPNTAKMCLAEAVDEAMAVVVVAGCGGVAGGVYYHYYCAVASWAENNYSRDR